MKLTNKPIIFALTFMFVAATTYSQSLSEQFKAAVVDYQKTSTNENALKVIELSKQIDPPPAVPEEAREPFVIANTMLKKAPDASTAAKAIESYDKAIHLAPWWADAYFNRAVARETAGQFDKAIDDLKLYLAFKLNDAERREAQDKIYSLKAEAEMAASKNAKAAESAAIDAKAKLFEGDWYQDVVSSGGTRARLTLSIKRDVRDVWQVQLLFTQNGNVVSDYHPYDVRFVGKHLRFKVDHTFGVQVEATDEVILTLSDDGNPLRLAYTPMPFTAAQEAHWVEWPTERPRPHVDEFKRQ